MTFNARQRAAIKRWMAQAVPLKGVYFRSVEYRYMDPADDAGLLAAVNLTQADLHGLLVEGHLVAHAPAQVDGL